MFTVRIDGPWITRSQLKKYSRFEPLYLKVTFYFGLLSCTLNRFILSVVERPTAIYYTLILAVIIFMNRHEYCHPYSQMLPSYTASS